MMNQRLCFPNLNCNNNFFAPPVNNMGMNMWMMGYSIDNNIPNNQFLVNNNGKINFLFKTSHGKRFMILFDVGRTVEDLILTFFKRINQEDLFHRGGVFFVYNTQHIDYHTKINVVNFFKYNVNPIIIVLDINNLIGA